MTEFDRHGADKQSRATRVVGCDIAFVVPEPVEIVAQIAASRTAGDIADTHLEVLIDGEPPSSLEEIREPAGTTMHVIHAKPGRLTVSYRATVLTHAPGAPEAQPRARAVEIEGRSTSDYERQVYLRPSRYCPSDHLIGFAVAEFGYGPDTEERIAAIAQWIRHRIGYVPGSSTVHDSAEDTLLTGVGTCRDFAHLGIALCRATGVPARFTSVYAPGLAPMDFHAVFEAFAGGRWCVYDPTGLAPRTSLVRIVTGRDAADTAFASVISGIADLESIDVTAVAEPFLPETDHLQMVELP
jgi:transglutaminase-like putative cysteine protease